MDKMAYNLFMCKRYLEHNTITPMKYIKKIFEYLNGRRMDSYEETNVELILSEIISAILVASVVFLFYYIFRGFFGL
jgi:hypothetical protein